MATTWDLFKKSIKIATSLLQCGILEYRTITLNYINYNLIYGENYMLNSFYKTTHLSIEVNFIIIFQNWDWILHCVPYSKKYFICNPAGDSYVLRN